LKIFLALLYIAVILFSMMNIQSAINSLRIARKLGKISSEQQARILRRLKHIPLIQMESQIKAKMLSVWAPLNNLRKQIDAEVQPILDQRNQAEDNLFLADAFRSRKNKTTVTQVKRKKKDRPALTREYCITVLGIAPELLSLS
jgi:hypothetical protein